MISSFCFLNPCILSCVSQCTLSVCLLGKVKNTTRQSSQLNKNTHKSAMISCPCSISVYEKAANTTAASRVPVRTCGDRFGVWVLSESGDGCKIRVGPFSIGKGDSEEDSCKSMLKSHSFIIWMFPVSSRHTSELMLRLANRGSEFISYL